MSRHKSTNPKQIRQCVDCGETHQTNRLRCCACYYRNRYGVTSCPGCGREIVARWAMCRECNGTVVRNRKWTPENCYTVEDRGHFTPCWIWRGGLATSGYGYAKLPSGPIVPAHRWMYIQLVGEIPDGVHFHHECEIPACVNPGHFAFLSPVDHAKLHNTGTDNAQAKLTPDQVKEIRSLYRRGSRDQGGPALAARFGVSQGLISNIILRKAWADVS